MDFFNKSFAQVGELFRSMTPAARLTAGLLFAVVVVSMGYLFRQSTSGPDAYLFGGAALSDGQLTRVEAAIAQAGLSGSEREGNRIRVPGGQKAAYLAAVADAGALPPNFNTILEDALGKGGPWESRDQTRQRLSIAKQQTLSEIVRAMYWVENAVVLYDEHETRDSHTLGTTKQVSASVSVKPNAGETLTVSRRKNIQSLVAHSVNMQAADVAVTDLGEGSVYGSDGETAVDLFPDGSLMQMKVAFETQKRDSIMKVLRDIPAVRVEVSADFDSTFEDRTHTVKPDPKPATQRETTSEEKSSQMTSEGGGRPGVTSQGPYAKNNAQSSQQPKNQSETTNKTTDTIYAGGVEENWVGKKGFQPKVVWATVAVPTSYVENLWKVRNPTATAPPKPDDLTKIQNDVKTNIEELVEPLVKLQLNLGQNQIKYVSVAFIDSLPATPIAPPSMASTATSWVGRYWSTLAMLGLAMFSLLVVRSVVNGKPSDGAGAATAGTPNLTLHADEQTAAVGTSKNESGDAPSSDRPRLRLKKGTSLKDDLVDIVRDDPNAAADILRSWIGKAG